ITADQWRADCLSSAGHPMVKTPNLDDLARHGVRFSSHFASAAPCGPSRASLHTGLYLQNHRSGTNGTPMDRRHGNWAMACAAFGHDPVLFGYTDTSADPRGLEPNDPRLFTYEGLLPGIRPIVPLDGRPKAWVEHLAAKGYEVPSALERAYGFRRPGPEWEDGAAHPRPLAFPSEIDDTAFLVGEAMAWMAAARNPFALHLSLLRPHPPWVAPEPFNALYDPAEVPPFSRLESPEEEAHQHPYLSWRLSRPGYLAHAEEKRLRRLKAVYFGLVTRVDAAIGELMDFLRASGLLETTLIVFTSDHGEELGDHWTLQKGGYFDEAWRVPLIIRDPRPAADRGRGRLVDSFTEHVDVVPTLLSAIGAPVGAEIDGEDLSPFLSGEAEPAGWRQEAHFEFDFRDVPNGAPEKALGISLDQCCLNVIRGRRWKYVHFAALPPLLFDLASDPHEFHDLAADPEAAAPMLASAQKLLSWRMQHDEHGLDRMALTDKGLMVRA
ncbi:MAG: alkaline phosphatase family protein, partial [Caulobacteraceae bacterium]